ncbi:MAG: carbon-nitrogen hydrolase family protein [Bryobacteraceae bacterium]|nr:carbon-nitrogen hydrolase family protein [Bryobacteraceae bacterium]
MRHAVKFAPLLLAAISVAWAQAPPAAEREVRVCAAQPATRLIDWRLTPAEALAEADKNLDALEGIVRRAGESRCDVLALPEDTMGLLHWETGNEASMIQVLPRAVERMLARLGRAAAAQGMYLVCSSDIADPDGTYRNAAFFLGRDGKEIGRYYKVNLPLHESSRKRGGAFPVFETPDLGGVGMLICYDMVMPEAVRSLALAGADIVFVPTMGGASYGGQDMSRAAFRTRAVDNFLYLVVAMRGGGSMVISPQGKVLAEEKNSNDIVMAVIDPFGGREAGDALNSQTDMRTRLFRERNPAAYGLLTDPNPPVLKKLPETTTIEEAVRVGGKTLTIGNERYAEAQALLKAGKTEEAVRAFEKLRDEFPRTWIDRAASEQLRKLRSETERHHK